MCNSDFEQYLLGNIIDEAELAKIEEHLLICDQCIDRAERLGIEIAMIRHALVSDQKAAVEPIRRICHAMAI